SVSEKLCEIASGPPVRLKPNACGSPDGVVTTSTLIVPRLTFVKVQVTVSPGPTATAVTGLPSSQVADRRSQAAPAGVCAIAYVPVRRPEEAYGVDASARENAAETASGPPVRLNEKSCESPAGIVDSSTTIRPRLT